MTKKIDTDALFKLAQIGCTYKEMASILHCSEELLEKKYKHIVDAGKTDLKQRIRMAQINLALNKEDKTMLIWLGKQLLGQSNTENVNINTQKSEKDNLIDEIYKRVADKTPDEDK